MIGENKKKQNIFALLILLLAFAARMYVWVDFSKDQNNFLQPDTMSYLHPGMQLLEKGVFPSFARTPVYPLFIAVMNKYLSNSYAFLAFTQILLSLVTVWLSYIVSLRIFGFFPAIICMLFIALDFQSMLTANFLLSDTLFTLILSVFISLLVFFYGKIGGSIIFDSVSFFVLGGCLSILSMCRPISFALFTVISLWMFFALKIRKKYLLILLFCMSSVSLPAFWTIRNHSYTGVYFFTTISSENIYAWRAAWNIAIINKIKFEDAHHNLKKLSTEKQNREHLNEGEMAEWKRKEGVNILKKYPLLTLSQGTKGLVEMYLDMTSFYEFDTKKESFLSVIMATWRLIHLLALYSGFVITVISLKIRIFSTEKQQILSLLFVVIAYFTLFSAGAEAYGRFRVPIVPALSMIAASGWAYLFMEYSKRRSIKTTY
ncbi:hypothetical protein VU07_01520 [Desulfobulbus sp. F4]|nr:hypothetical protein [Desulfobulbus sp. F3]MCW5200484.1 hypothetical protein [Desulfobulbus sp. F4]